MGLVLFSPKVRHHLGFFLEQLVVAERKKAQRIETERRASLISEAIDQIQLPPNSQAELALPSASAGQLVLPAATEPDARWRDVLVTPPVALVLGKRGSGKTALAYRLLELFRYRLTPDVVGAPAQAAKLLPDWIGTVPSLEDLPPDCIALVDEAYLHYHSRRSMAKESADMSQQLNLSRQRNQTLIFVSQEARQVDRNIASSASVVIFKEMGML